MTAPDTERLIGALARQATTHDAVIGTHEWVREHAADAPLAHQLADAVFDLLADLAVLDAGELS